MECGRLIGFIALFAVANSASVDPCVHLEIIDDVSRNTGYSLQQQEHPRCDRIQPKWYRYLDSDRGVMATSCPTGSQCGTISQVWMNDTVPGVGCETSVEVCIRQDDNCCERKNTVRVKNCGAFVAYQLIPLPGCLRYCYGNTTRSSGADLSTQLDCLPTGSTRIPKETTQTTTSKPKKISTTLRLPTTLTPTSAPTSNTVNRATTSKSSSTSPSTYIVTLTSFISSTKPTTSKSAFPSAISSHRSSTSKSTSASVFSSTKTSTPKSTTSTVIFSTTLTTMKIASSIVFSSTGKSTMNYSPTKNITSSLSPAFATNNSSSAKGSMDTAVIVGSSIGGVIVMSLLLTGVIAAIVRIQRRREKERKRKAYEAVVMNRNTVENQCYSYESNWTRDSRSTGAFNSRFR